MVTPGSIIGEWIGFGALTVSIIAIALTFVRKPTWVPVHRLDELRIKIVDLEKSNERCMLENTRLENRANQLESQITLLRSDIEFWQSRYRHILEHGHNTEGHC